MEGVGNVAVVLKHADVASVVQEKREMRAKKDE